MGKLHLLILMVGNASTFLNGKHNNWICIYISHIFSLEFSVPYECLQFVSNNRPMENSRTLLKLFVTTVHMNKYLIDSAFTVVCPFCFFFQFHKAFLLLHCHYRCHLRFHDYFHSHWHSTPLSLWLWDTLRLCHSFFGIFENHFFYASRQGDKLFRCRSGHCTPIIEMTAAIIPRLRLWHIFSCQKQLPPGRHPTGTFSASIWLEAISSVYHHLRRSQKLASFILQMQILRQLVVED